MFIPSLTLPLTTGFSVASDSGLFGFVGCGVESLTSSIGTANFTSFFGVGGFDIEMMEFSPKKLN